MRRIPCLLTLIALCGFTATSSNGLLAAPDTSKCIAKFATQSSTKTNSSDAPYSEPADHVDINKDGRISFDERIVACKTNIWSKFPA